MKVRVDVRVLAGWLLFLTIYTMVWDANITHLLHIASPLASMASKENPFPRSSIFLLGTYTACRVTLLLSLVLLLNYCIMSCVQCILPFLQHIPFLFSVITWMYSEGVMFSSMLPRLLPFHAAVLTCSLAIATVYAVVYTSKADLRVPERCMSVMVRDVMCMSAVGVCAYAGLALFLFTV